MRLTQIVELALLSGGLVVLLVVLAVTLARGTEVGGIGWMWNDLPMRLAVVGLAVALTVCVGLLRWISQHYVCGAASGWQLTIWEKAMDAESRSREPERENEEAACCREAEVAGDAL